MKKRSVKSIAAIGIGVVLFFVLGRFISIPSPVPNTNISVQYGLLAFMAIVYGPVSGALIGFLGHTLIDLTYGSPWFSWIIASAVFGVLMGLTAKFLNLEAGEISRAGLIRFNAFQTLSHMICWGAAAPILDILIYQEPLEKLFAQGLVAGISNAVTTGIVGSLLCITYSATRPNAKNSLPVDGEPS